MEEIQKENYFDLDSSLGTIRGYVVEAPNGSKVTKFLGIPYAQQPVGKLRFKPLQPLILPLGIPETPFQALNVGKSSIQSVGDPTATTLPVGEDCIHLNIFAPLENIATPDKGVFFHIHGGGFFQGSGSEPLYDMVSFVERHNCVAVSINYRLGILGFLSMPPLIEENLGLKDQQVALQWVHEHIKSFGGDPNKITLYGCSAGSASCHYHCLNKTSIDLFDRVILSSGAVNPLWGYTSGKERKRRTAFILKQLGCPETNNQEDIVEFLLSLDSSKFGNLDFTTQETTKAIPLPATSFMETPPSLVPLKKKPILIGLTREEGLIFLQLLYPSKSNESTALTKTRRTMSDAFGEVFFFGPVRRFLEELTTQQKDYPLFAYVFDYTTDTRGKDVLCSSFLPVGIGNFHGFDIAFFLNQLGRNSPYVDNVTEADIRVNSAMAEMVETFMTQDVDSINLERYSAWSQKVNKVTKNGIATECFDFKNSVYHLPMPKLAFSSLLLKLFPNKL